MTYQWTTDGRTIRGELDARQVAELTAAGNAPQPVTGYRCQRAGELHWGEYTAAEIADMAADGWSCAEGEPWPPPVPPPPTLAELKAAALTRYQYEAADCLRTNLPSPWDTLRDVATPEFQAWADEFCALVATELTRLETAVSEADAAALEAIVADWPEVE